MQPHTDPTRDTREKVRELTEKGLTPREIAALLGVSVQRIYQHLQALDMTPASKETA